MKKKTLQLSSARLTGIREDLRNAVLHDPDLASAIAEAAQKNAVFMPAVGNLGDGLIQLGAFDLFEHLGWNPKPHYASEATTLPPGSHVVIGGGALFEGLWEERIQGIRPILESGGSAVILPCSIVGFDDLLVRHAKQLRIFLRERRSYERLATHPELADRVSLVPDLAFAVKDSFYAEFWRKDRQGTLNIFRTDAENPNPEIPFNNLDLSLLWNGDLWGERDSCESRLRDTATIMSRFARVRTNRLHMGILAAAIGCEVELHPSLHGKIEGVYDASLSAFPNVEVHFAERAPSTPAEAPDGAALQAWPARDELLARLLYLSRRQAEEIEPELERLRAALANAEPELAARAERLAAMEQALRSAEREARRLDGELQALRRRATIYRDQNIVQIDVDTATLELRVAELEEEDGRLRAQLASASRILSSRSRTLKHLLRLYRRKLFKRRR